MDPLALLARDRARARAADDPMATLCVLATVDANGLPQARTLVLRDVNERLALFMNASSPKYAELERRQASICVYMPSIQVQYRAAVMLHAVEPHVVHGSWHLRPDMPKVLDWFYTRHRAQSTAIDSRAALKEALTGLELPDPLVAPETAVGFYLEFGYIDRLDLAQADGLHERRTWERRGDTWHTATLVP